MPEEIRQQLREELLPLVRDVTSLPETYRGLFLDVVRDWSARRYYRACCEAGLIQTPPDISRRSSEHDRWFAALCAEASQRLDESPEKRGQVAARIAALELIEISLPASFRFWTPEELAHLWAQSEAMWRRYLARKKERTFAERQVRVSPLSKQ